LQDGILHDETFRIRQENNNAQREDALLITFNFLVTIVAFEKQYTIHIPSVCL